MGIGVRADMSEMTSITHHGDVLRPARLRRALGSPRLRSRGTLAHALAPLAALGVLVLLVEGHGLSWLAGLVAGASTTAWLVSTRRPRVNASKRSGVDQGDGETREQLSLVGGDGWRAMHDVEARFGRYQHVAVGPGGVVLMQSWRLQHPRPAAALPPAETEDAEPERELMLLRRRALAASANLRDEIQVATGQAGWVQAVIVVWSEFPAGCVQDGRCVFVSGTRLADWLRRRPGQLPPARADEIFAALEGLTARVAA